MSDLLLGYRNTQENINAGKETYVIDDRGDIQFDARGQLILVDDEDLLRQQIGKALLTEQGSSVISPQYGTTLLSFIGQNIYSEPSYALMKQTILDALGFIVNSYIDSTNSKEKLGTVETLSLRVNEGEKVTIDIELAVTNEETQDVIVRIVLE